MKTVKIGELKTHLSKYLKLVQKGERIRVLDRNTPVAELVPLPKAAAEDPWQKWSDEGGIRLGTQDWATLEIKPIGKPIDVQKILDEIREDSTW